MVSVSAVLPLAVPSDTSDDGSSSSAWESEPSGSQTLSGSFLPWWGIGPCPESKLAVDEWVQTSRKNKEQNAEHLSGSSRKSSSSLLLPRNDFLSVDFGKVLLIIFTFTTPLRLLLAGGFSLSRSNFLLLLRLETVSIFDELRWGV
jgi:hypothetical protein